MNFFKKALSVVTCFTLISCGGGGSSTQPQVSCTVDIYSDSLYYGAFIDTRGSTILKQINPNVKITDHTVPGMSFDYLWNGKLPVQGVDPPVITQPYPPFKDINIDSSIVVIELGFNDIYIGKSVDETSSIIDNFLLTLRSKNKNVIIAGIPNLYLVPGSIYNQDLFNEDYELNDKMKQLADKYGFIYLDQRAVQDNVNYAVDGMHRTKDGLTLLMQNLNDSLVKYFPTCKGN